jgi:membrane dipeptidase
LERLPSNGGVVMVNFYNAFINCTNSSSADVNQVADHIDYIISKCGSEDHVGIGADFDGVGGELPIGLEDVSKYPNLFAELIRRGYSDERIIKILGGNLLRVFAEAEAVAANLKGVEIPYETICDFDFSGNNDTCRQRKFLFCCFQFVLFVFDFVF